MIAAAYEILPTPRSQLDCGVHELHSSEAEPIEVWQMFACEARALLEIASRVTVSSYRLLVLRRRSDRVCRIGSTRSALVRPLWR